VKSLVSLIADRRRKNLTVKSARADQQEDVLATAGDWLVTTDGLQWILRRRVGTDRRTGKPVWESVSFVRSTRGILERCMREKETPPEDARRLLAGLGERFSPPKVVNPSPVAEDALPKDGHIMLHVRA
jgi:hypothetical protein